MPRPIAAASAPSGAHARADHHARSPHASSVSPEPGTDGFRTGLGWDDAIRYVAEIFRNIIHAHGPGRGRLLRQRTARHRDRLHGRQALQGPARDQQHRLEQPALHGGRGGGISVEPRQRRAADLLRRHRPRRRHRHLRQQHGRGASGHVRSRQGGEEGPARPADRRHRSPTHRDGPARGPASAGRGRRRHRSLQCRRADAARSRRHRSEIHR